MIRPIVGMKKLTIQQILAIRDTKILEACCIKLLCNDIINPLREQNEMDIVNEISSEFKNIHYAYQISPDLQTSNEAPEEFQRINKFAIPDYFFDRQMNHRFMKCMQNEPADEHRERVKNYLMSLSGSKISELIGCIDPSESKLNQLLILLLEKLILRTQILSNDSLILLNPTSIVSTPQLIVNRTSSIMEKPFANSIPSSSETKPTVYLTPTEEEEEEEFSSLLHIPTLITQLCAKFH
ncbi:unnamed protein product [Rotaria sordida]|nr:unnamed protein product [Rotaria sordida]